MDSERHDQRDEFGSGAGDSAGWANETGDGAELRGDAGPGGHSRQGHRLDQDYRQGQAAGANRDDRFDERVRLRGDEQTDRSAGGGQRRDGLRRVRHMSNWTAAALLAGTGVATVALAAHATQTGTTSTASGYSSTHGTGVQQAAPHVKGSVVTSGGSGATVTTTKKVVNGKVVVTKVRHAPVWHDN